MAPDERIVIGHELVAAPVDLLLRMLYPAAYPLHDPSGEWGTAAEVRRCNARRAAAAAAHAVPRCPAPPSPVLHPAPSPHPRLTLQGQAVQLPDTVPLSTAYMVEGGAYLIDTGRMLILWLGRTLAPQWVADVFGLALSAIPAETQQLVLEPPKAHPMSKRVGCAALRRRLLWRRRRRCSAR